jgi:hypothetical protein
MTTRGTLGRCRLIELATVRDVRGNLTFVEGDESIPFEIRRVFYLYDVPVGESRAKHAHVSLEQVLIAAAGSFDVAMEDGSSRTIVTLDRPSVGLYVPHMIWSEIENFSPGAVCLALASDHFSEDDYIRDKDTFISTVRVEA